MGYDNRRDAGCRLASRLRRLTVHSDEVVTLGLPRGGVPVAFEVARALGTPLDVLVVRKLGVPFQPELAMGAVGEDGVLILNERIVRSAHVSEAELGEVERQARVEVRRRAERFRRGSPRLPLTGRTALVVDDGIATGATARAACAIARVHGAARVVLAAPVCAPESFQALRSEVDELVCLDVPPRFVAVGEFYRDFRQTTDDEVESLLEQARRPAPPAVAVVASSPAPAGDLHEVVKMPVGGVSLPGHLTVPEHARGLVVFAHGSGSSRHSPRNRYVARVLREAGLGTLLFDLLSADEELDRSAVFDIELLAERLVGAARWARAVPDCRDLPIGYFGASTGAAAALWAAAGDPGVAAVVSRGGRPDLAAPRLGEVVAPTLLIVGGDDLPVLELNRRAMGRLRGPARLVVVPGATHLFEEPGALEQAAAAGRDWFVEHMTVRAAAG
ncbi:MAG: phosphoribosyltransferase [Pseudonocardia sp.]|uniref:phosphoribosyltransferase family protein n=1 Tax=unclassified Pseudonocardia TaxID=2619320 RepID=UPI000868C4AB|nr:MULTISPECIES: phosphoribosyltransferase family protein [unclassified Pseudonocardia]MBN9112375.1 phosphoribosyltransferase [Pseudonocardia sp.]ODU27352.1 MAG: phosphoribosyl transferase [Pseudonocardia sp. SCN 72-51]ODV08965.1 MAG: phosphoribosyl transferase [Pseudonocardia sp. SCN 73-27]